MKISYYKIFGFEAITSTMFLFNLQYPSRVWKERITAKTVELFYSLFFLLAKMAKNSMSRNANFKSIFLLVLLKATVTVVGVTHGWVYTLSRSKLIQVLKSTISANSVINCHRCPCHTVSGKLRYHELNQMLLLNEFIVTHQVKLFLLLSTYYTFF